MTARESDNWSIVLPIPTDAPAPPRSKGVRYSYLDAKSRLLGYIDRTEDNGSKTFLPLTLWQDAASSALTWKRKAWPAPRPIYGLDQLAERPKAPLLVCEGEKAVEAARRLTPEFVIVTSPNGASAAKSADWSAMQGRDVIIWPDADEPGTKYAKAVARLTLAAGAKTVRICDPPSDVAAGWDAADAEAEGWTAKHVSRFLENTTPVINPKAKVPVKPAEQKKPPSIGARTAAIVEALELWLGEDGATYATLPTEQHSRHVNIGGAQFKGFLTLAFYHETGVGPSTTTIEEARNLAAAIAMHRGLIFPVHRRVGLHDGALYISLGEPKSTRAVKITPTEWGIVSNPPIKFVHTAGMLALVEPERGELIEQFLQFANAKSDADETLLLGWIISALHPTGPYPVLVVTGEQGSAKSTLTRLLRRLIDPNDADSASTPRDERDLAISAQNRHLLSYDNVSRIQPWLSDALSRIATSGSFTTRKLHSDRDEVIMKVSRPMILNGITDFASRSDFADRCIFVELAPIPPEQRLPESKVLERFEALEPVIFGAICDALQSAVANYENIQLPWSPRMADAARWVTAAEPSLGWESGRYIEALKENSEAAKAISLDADPVALTVIKFVQSLEGGVWEGSATALLDALNIAAADSARFSPGWPKSAATLGGQLKRNSPMLRAEGVAYTRHKGGSDSSRKIVLRWMK